MYFTPDGFKAFAAAIDAVRATLLASTLQRQQISSFELPRNKLDEMLKISVDDNSVDARWLVTLFQALAPSSCISSEDKVSDKGFQDLTELQLIKIGEDEHWSPTNELMELASNWLVPLPAIYHEAITIKKDGSKDVFSSIALRGSGPLCVLAFDSSDSDKPYVSLCSMNDDDFWLYLMGQLTPPKTDNRSKPKKRAEIVDSSKTPEQVSDDEVLSCDSCSAPLKPGTKFCTSCGEKVTEKPSIPSCPGCGKQITSSNKFCVACGVKL